MKQLNLVISREVQDISLQFNVKRMINAGYVGRNIEAVQAHIDELSLEGVPAPASIPMIFPVLSENITTKRKIEVVGDRTSGEVEFVVLFHEEKVYIGVGSDHTDRELESVSISKSKQICENVISKIVWDFDDVKDRWDSLSIRSWVKTDESDGKILYQDALLGSIISADDLIDLVKLKLKDSQTDGLIIYSGTVPIVTDKMNFGDYFKCEIADPKTGRSLVCEYEVEKLEFLHQD